MEVDSLKTRMPDGLTTERLILRRWQERDKEAFARINADLRVMEFMPARLGRFESDRLIDRFERHFVAHGFGLYATELRGAGSLVGFIGLSVPGFDAPFMPAVEVGWRLGFEHWGQGLATEGAREVVRFAFEILGLDGLVSFTTPLNLRSRRVMEKLGMTNDPCDDFEHPNLQVGHWLRPHVLYRLSREQWIGNQCPPPDLMSLL